MMKRHTDNPCELAREFPLFANLEDLSCEKIISHGLTQRYRKGQIIFQEGDAPKGLFLIRSGAAKIFKESESGREQILAIMREGDSIAELPLFDNAPYPASCAAIEAAKILFIPKDVVEKQLASDPKFAVAIIRTLALRMRSLVELIADLSLRQVRQRLARYLLEESKGDHRLRLRFTNEQLAARLGSVRDVISRTLSGLQNDGIIRVKGRSVEILDLARLEEESK